VSISVPLTLGAMPDGLQVRVRVAYQACDQRECRAPDSLVLEAPLRMLPAGR
jgi:hypothetical protein